MRDSVLHSHDMDGPELFDKLLTLRGLNPNALATAIKMPKAQSGFDRFRKGQIRQPKRDTRIERAADRLGVNVLAFYDGDLAEREWERVSAGTATAVSALRKTTPRAGSIPVPMLENAGSMGGGEDELAMDVVMGDIVLAREWITREVRPSSAEALRFVHALGDSMKPTCESGDILLVDTGHRTVDIDGVYVLRANQRLYIKRVRQTLAGGWEVSSDNATVKTVDVLDGREQIEVLGRAVWVWNGKRL